MHIFTTRANIGTNFPFTIVMFLFYLFVLSHILGLCLCLDGSEDNLVSRESLTRRRNCTYESLGCSIYISVCVRSLFYVG